MTFVNVLVCVEFKGFLVKPCRLFYNRSTLILSIAIILTGLSTTDTMPLERSDEFWLNSCGRQLRHSRSSEMNNRVPKQQMKILIFQLNRLIKNDLKQLYPHYPHDSRSTGNCFSVKAFMGVLNKQTTLNKQKRIKNATVILYQMLIKLGKFIDKLMDVPVKTDLKFNELARLRIYEKTRMHLRNAVCEFNTSLTDSGITSIEAESFDKMIPDLNEDCIQKTFDSSTVQPIDVDFFNKLLKFLKRSQRTLRMNRPKNKKGKKNGGKKILGKNNGAKKTRRKKNKSKNSSSTREIH